MEITVKGGNGIRTFGGWYRDDYVYADGIELMGFIQVGRHNGRIESTTHFQYTSCAVLGTDVPWLIRQNDNMRKSRLPRACFAASASELVVALTRQHPVPRD
jgi:hypothetical protein